MYDEDILESVKEEIPCDIRIVPKGTFKVTNDEYAEFIRSIDNDPPLPRPSKNATSLTGGQGKRNTYDGYNFDSFWEYAFYRYHKDVQGDVIIRNELEWIPYYDETGKQRKFYYDFIVNSFPYEVKGWFRPTDIAKQQATSGQVTFVSGDEIKPMMKELDAKIPSWRLDCQFL